jgi:hypothetical protein
MREESPMRKRTSLVVVAAVAAVVWFLPSAPNPAAAQSKDALSIADNNSVYIDGKSFKVVAGSAGGDVSALIQKLDARDLGPGAIIFRSGDKLYLYTAAAPLGQQRYGSDRRDYGNDNNGRNYGSDRRDYANENNGRNYGSDRRDYANENNGRNYGSDRRDYANENNGRNYGSDRRDYANENNGRNYGSDRRDYANENNGRNYGSDRRDYANENNGRNYGSDRRDYGSERDESPSTAQSEREWREWQQSQRPGNNRRNYGSDRRDYGSDRYAADPERPAVYINDPEYVQYVLKKSFDDNWTTLDTK